MRRTVFRLLRIFPRSLMTLSVYLWQKIFELEKRFDA